MSLSDPVSLAPAPRPAGGGRPVRTVRSTRSERVITGAPEVELIVCTTGRCVGCGHDATIAAHRVGSVGSALDVPWCSRACRIRILNLPVSL
jgi:hypothetical protein